MHIQSNINTVVFSIFLVFCTAISCKTEHSQNSNLAAEKEKLMTRVVEFNMAFEAGEIEKLQTMITNNYVHTNGNSKSIHKEDWLAYLKQRKKQLSSGRLTVKNYEMHDTEIEMHKQTAIVTAKVSFTTITPNEQKESEFRVTNLWVKEEGIWKRAGFHDTRIK